MMQQNQPEGRQYSYVACQMDSCFKYRIHPFMQKQFYYFCNE